MVEFALVLPLFLLLMFALIDFSRLLFTYASVSNGTRELARSASISNGWNSAAGAAAIQAFNNTTIIAGGVNASTDTVTVRVGNATCARALDIGGTCAPGALDVAVCPLPLQVSTCTPTLATGLPTPTQGGFVEVQANYTFQFNPLLQTRVENVVYVSFMRPTSAVTTTARAYIE
jgi:Flp pilus assembly protein TadG